jgi:hypothetical protein
MNKQFLFRKASAIHAIKCFKIADFNIALQSFETLAGFKNRIQAAVDDTELNFLNGELDVWANETPVATPEEMNQLIFKK